VELLDAVPGVADVEADPARALGVEVRRDKHERGAIGHRERSLVALRRGKYSRHRLARRGDVDVAVDATVRAAAMRAGRERTAIAVTPADVRRKVREHHVPFELCFVVDNSYSLHADRLVEQVKGLVFRLLEDAATRGDRVSLVCFRRGVGEAAVVLRPTSSSALASRRLAEIPLAGRTPLAHALHEAGRLLRQERAKRPNAHPVVVVVSDGLPNVPLRRGGDPVADTLAEARALRRAGASVVVIDALPPGRVPEESCGRRVAAAAEGRYLPAADVSPGLLAAVLEADG
jgi:magnesium chelatase subunit D